VTEAIQGVPGVKNVDVSLEGKSATIQFDGQVDEAALRRAVEDAGYRVA
jgi:copper chaperone CopZ